jgi:LysR family transcriptional activator of nhaA
VGHDLDLVIADAPVPPASGIRAFSHLIAESGVSFLAAPALAASLRGTFPESLRATPFVMPTSATVLRRSLELWLDERDLRVHVVAEIEDSALLKAFGAGGMGVFAVPTIIEHEAVAGYSVTVVGRTRDIAERFFAISPERRLKHPAVVAICSAAQGEFLPLVGE